MSAPAIAVPGTRPQTTGTTQSETEIQQQQQQQEIARLAYALWQQRGASDGSSEQDWLEAERIVQNQNQPAISRTGR